LIQKLAPTALETQPTAQFTMEFMKQELVRLSHKVRTGIATETTSSSDKARTQHQL